MGTEIPGVQLHESQATEEALGAESGRAIQGAIRELTRRTQGISLAPAIQLLVPLGSFVGGGPMSRAWSSVRTAVLAGCGARLRQAASFSRAKSRT
jgi:hypothetical protein